jgi:hypothetical protein
MAQVLVESLLSHFLKEMRVSAPIFLRIVREFSQYTSGVAPPPRLPQR